VKPPELEAYGRIREPPDVTAFAASVTDKFFLCFMLDPFLVSEKCLSRASADFCKIGGGGLLKVF